MRYRGIIVLAMTAVLVLASIGVAFAVVEKNGSTNCSPPTGQVFLRSQGAGTVRHYYPSGTLRATFSNPSSTVRISATGMQGTTWKVTSTGTLNNPGTYGYCGGV